MKYNDISERDGGLLGGLLKFVGAVAILAAMLFGAMYYLRQPGNIVERVDDKIKAVVQQAGNEISENISSAFTGALETWLRDESVQAELITFVSTNSPAVMADWLRTNGVWLGEQGFALTGTDNGP